MNGIEVVEDTQQIPRHVRGDRPICPRRDLSLTHLPRTHFRSTFLILPLVAIGPALPFPVIWLQARSTPSFLIRGANGQNLFWQKVWIPSSGHTFARFLHPSLGISRPSSLFPRRRSALGCPRRASWVLERGSIAPPAALVTAPQLRESTALIKVAERCIKGSKYTHPAQ